MEREGIISHRLYGLKFGVYSAKEIKKLSMREIVNPDSFDAFSHSTPGGLYDTALGPSDLFDVCPTCNLKAMHCPGHMGHIVLPLPVFNPVFFKFLCKILQRMCFECHRFRCHGAVKMMLKTQMELLDKGYLSASERFKQMFSEITQMFPAYEKEEMCLAMEKKILKAAEECLNNEEPPLKQQPVKNVLALKQTLFKQFFSQAVFCKLRCPKCKTKPRKLRAEMDSRIYFSSGLKQREAEKMVLAKKKWRQAKKINMDGPSEALDDPEVIEMEEQDAEKEVAELMEQSILTPLMARDHLRQLWKQEHDMMRHLMPSLDIPYDRGEAPTDVFFIDIMPVSAPRFRPCMSMGSIKFENPRTTSLAKVIRDCDEIRKLLYEKTKQGKDSDDESEDEAEEKAGLENKLFTQWQQLQVHINCLVDADSDRFGNKTPGVKQLLEKKQGLLRMHMMGKRVNFAARSVISPDPFINTNEIGIPTVFALTLTYPEPVTPWNFQELKQAVLNGPNVHPGATAVENEDGFVVRLSATDPLQREAIAKQLLTPSPNAPPGAPNKKVLRHLRNGDVLLLNRQPTLHKPSIQAHRARVLPGEKTLRLHYANCKAYNADFDGDEMNAHFPQNEIARAEAYTIASTDFNYLVPKDGSPLAGLIQDHMIGGVALSIRGRFFSRADYQQLVFAALTDKNGPVRTLPPAIIKPRQLWSGKQVLSTIFLNIIPKDKAPLNITGTSKISHKNWQNGAKEEWRVGGSPFTYPDQMGESEVVIRHGELLVGVLDKAHYGNTAYGLVHCCYELYGGIVAGQLLTALSKLFTYFLQWRGFTLGVADILCTEQSDGQRRKIMAKGATCGPQVAAKALGLPQTVSKKVLTMKMQEAHYERGGEGLKDLDLSMKGATDQISNEIVTALMPDGLEKKFPENNLQLMVQAGAKGSSVNCMQISCLLGQIELEGRRPQLMLSGKGLPSFQPYDTSPRAGGFIDGRFLTGIRPQEYFFHCMAGREGLIDTAVKTSRSGYLQRCIVKHLEGLMVGYDLSVRDSDGSVVQFNYGEDSLDILKTQFMNRNQFPFMIHNKEAIVSEQKLRDLHSRIDTKKAQKDRKKIAKWHKTHSEVQRHKRQSAFLNFCREMHSEAARSAPADETEEGHGRDIVSRQLCEAWTLIEPEDKAKYDKHMEKCPDPALSKRRPDRHFGSISERMDKIIEDYIYSNPDKLVSDVVKSRHSGRINTEGFRDLMNLRYLEALAQPGEPVGLIAAQSIGEPSTQMTLNTFHFAGRGEMNVTLGIPRLREILMVASDVLATPAMDIPVRPPPPGTDPKLFREKVDRLRLSFSRVTLAQVLQDVEVTETLSTTSGNERCRLYRVLLRFLPHEHYRDEFSVTPADVLRFVEKTFFQRLQEQIKKKLSILNKASLVSTARVSGKGAAAAEQGSEEVPEERDGMAAEEDENDIEEDDMHDGDAVADKLRRRQDAEGAEYEGEDEERGMLESDSGGEESGVEADSDQEGGEDDEQEKANEEADESILRPGSPPTPVTSSAKKRRIRTMDEKRIQAVLGRIAMATQYLYDPLDELWCQVTLKVTLSDKKLDMTSMIEDLANGTVLAQVPKINRALLHEETTPGQEGLRFKTEGVNIPEIYKHQDIFDLNRLYTNNIKLFASHYGIEAACKVIIKEMRDVFAAYGIDVDYHHLSLIADYMTFEGDYKPFTRVGLENNASPLQKMSFETCMNFLRTATLSGATDDLNSPSARIVVGKVVNTGTGCFNLMQPLQPITV